MKDKELLKTVTSFRKGVLQGMGGDSAHSMCYVVCMPLQGYLSFCGVDTELTECELHIKEDVHHHYILTLKDGKIIDPTASQFNHLWKVIMPHVYFGVRPDYYKQLTPSPQSPIDD